MFVSVISQINVKHIASDVCYKYKYYQQQKSLYFLYEQF